MYQSKRKVVVGVGEIIAGDNGLGKHAVRSLQQKLRNRTDVEFVEAGTVGFDIEQIIEESSHLLILDAADAGAAPGTLIEFARNEIEFFCGLRPLPHQREFHTLLCAAKGRGRLPEHTHFVGMQPHFLTPGFDISNEARAAMPAMLHRAATILQGWDDVTELVPA